WHLTVAELQTGRMAGRTADRRKHPHTGWEVRQRRWRWEGCEVGGHRHNRRAIILGRIRFTRAALRRATSHRNEVYGCQWIGEAKLVAKGIGDKLQQGCRV